MARELEGAAGRELKRLPHLRTLSADNGRMKKSVCILLACVSIPAWSQGWKLPVFTVRYEAAGGAAEDPDDETFLASSLRNTLSLQMKETADEAAFGLMLTFSGKDSYQPADRSGDYSYFKLIQDGTIRVNDAWKLGYDLGVKAMDYRRWIRRVFPRTSSRRASAAPRPCGWSRARASRPGSTAATRPRRMRRIP